MSKFPLERVLRKRAPYSKTVVPTSFHLTSENWQSVSSKYCNNKQGMAENFAECQMQGGWFGLGFFWGF